MNTWRAMLSGLCASLVALGLARFAYTPMIPALIDEQWLAPSQVVYLGAANLVGYLGGALLSQRIASWMSAPAALKLMMLLATASFFACAVPLSVPWLFVWRFAAGVSGAVLMVLAAPAILPHIPQSRRGLASGAIFTGVGLGVGASGTLVPLLLQSGVVATWCGLGALSALLTVLAWSGFPDERPAAAGTVAPRQSRRLFRAGLLSAYAGYGLEAFGSVPHMVFLVDFIARGLGQGLAIGSQYWVLFGIGAMIGPIALGSLADRIGFRPTMRLIFLGQAIAIGLPTVTASVPALVVSSLVAGALLLAAVPIVLGRVNELLAPDPSAQKAGWSIATTGFALGQAIGAYALSYLFVQTNDYVLLFQIGALALLLGLAFDVMTGLFSPDRRHAAAGRT